MDANDGSKRAKEAESSAANSASTDVVLVQGRSPDGKGLSVIRQRDDRLEQGVVVPLEPGKPIQGDVVTLRPRPEFPLLCDVHVEYQHPVKTTESAGAHPVKKGPGQVATDQYRANWDRIFDAGSKARGQLN